MSINGYFGLERKIPADKILCYVTGRLRDETEEEKVRQRVARSLVEEYGYKKSDLEINFGIKIGSNRYPADIVIFQEGKSHTQENAYMIIETKNEKTKYTDSTEGIAQLKSYMSASLNCQFGLWTNGVDKYCFQRVREDRVENFQEIIDIPVKGKSLEEYDRLDFEELRPAFELRSVFKRCHNHIAGEDGLPKEKAFMELLKVIFCKVQDEKGNALRFYVTNKELKSQHGLKRVKERLDYLFDDVKRYPKYRHIFEKEEEIIELTTNTLAYIVSQLQYYSFLQTDTDVKGEAYEEIVGSNIRGDKGEFFTPRNVCKVAVECVFSLVAENELTVKTILDPACGTGGFLIAVINYMKRYFRAKELEKWDDTDEAENMIPEDIKTYSEERLYGMDFNPILVRATQMNEVMHGNGSGNLTHANTLLHPSRWPEETKSRIALESFDIIFTNPPFGEDISITDFATLNQYDLGHVWDNKTFEMKAKVAASVPPEELFIERCLQLLVPAGLLAIVLPDSILSNPGKKYIRHWVLRNAKVLASIDLPRETFLPNSKSKTSLLILQKKTRSEKLTEQTSGKMIDYDVFMYLPKYVGHDSRGKPIYKMTPDGQEVLQEQEREVVRIVDKKKIKEKEKVLLPVHNDELPEVAAAFKEWGRKKGK
jgi:type I restriction enzyme M protein